MTFVEGPLDGRSDEDSVSDAKAEQEYQSGDNELIDSPVSRVLLESELNLRSVLGVALTAVNSALDQRSAWSASRGSIATRAELRAAIATYVSGLREQGLQSEQVLVRLKALIQRAMPDHLTLSQARMLTEDVVRWSIDAYYGTSTSTTRDGDVQNA